MASDPAPSTDKWMNFLTEANLDDDTYVPSVLLPSQPALEQVACSAEGGGGNTEEGEKTGSSSRKRSRDEGATTADVSCSKANREKMRRDRLNDRCGVFLRKCQNCPATVPGAESAIGAQLGVVGVGHRSSSHPTARPLPTSLPPPCRFLERSRPLQPGKAPKADKASILCYAMRVLSQLHCPSHTPFPPTHRFLELSRLLKPGAQGNFLIPHAPSPPNTHRFLELSRSLEPGKAPKADKASILCYAMRVLSQLHCPSHTPFPPTH
ncbi:unnamed protein product, partial [Closterium sp. NIES-54]